MHQTGRRPYPHTHSAHTAQRAGQPSENEWRHLNSKRMNDTARKTLFGLIFLVVIAIVMPIYRYVSSTWKNSGAQRTIGKLEYYERCLPSFCYHYCYVVNGYKYFGTIKGSYDIPNCEEGDRCDSLYFVVYFSAGNPSQSEIDLKDPAPATADVPR